MPLRRSDLEVFELAADNGNVFTEYYFAGFKFQDWQLLLHHAYQANINIIGGVGSGKTTGAAISAGTWAAMTEGFQFMDVAPTSWQATLMYDAFLRFAEAGRYYEKFITRVARKPYPVIELYNKSEMRFMTAQDDISRLRGWEGDWMHGDEFAFLKTLRRTLAIMRTRLRGKTPLGRPRLGRLSITTTATDNPELWERFDRGLDDETGNYLSFTVRTQDNPHLTARDIALMIEDIPEEIRAVEMDGQRPVGRGLYFPLHVIQSCEDWTLNDLAYAAAEAKVPGAVYEESSRVGVMRFSLPYLQGHEYLIVGDPGTGNLPRRNAGVIMVFDITGFPLEPESKAKMVAFAWVNGNGRYENFEVQFKTWWEYYRCGLNAAIESTGPQKSFAEYAFTLGLHGQQMLVEEADMSGNKKMVALQAAIQVMQRGLVVIPFIRGMRSQLSAYELPDTKLAQDIVSAFMVAADWLRRWRIWDLFGGNDTSDDEDGETSTEDYARSRLDSRPKR